LLPAGTPTSQSAALSVVRRERPNSEVSAVVVVAAAAAVAADSIHERCIRPFALSAELRPWFRSGPVATGQYTATIVSVVCEPAARDNSGRN